MNRATRETVMGAVMSRARPLKDMSDVRWVNEPRLHQEMRNSWKPGGITDNRRSWKEKEFHRLFPNTLYRNLVEFEVDQNSYIYRNDFNLREFKKYYNMDKHESKNS